MACAAFAYFDKKKKLRRIAIRVLIFYHEFANFLKEHESHEFHESGKKSFRELAIIIICGFLTRIVMN